LRKESGGQGAALCSSLLITMRVRFKMDGGFVYLPARSEPTTLDTDDLPSEEAKELQRLIEAAGFFELPETSTPPRGAADYLRYTISVTTPEHSHTVHLSDPIEDPDIQALVEYLEAKARESPPAQ
jgi:hypothetical protein